MLNTKFLNRRCYSVKKHDLSGTLYNSITKEYFKINIPNEHVTRELCDVLIKHDPRLIEHIPRDLHTEEMYDYLMKKNKWVFLSFNMNDELREKYLTKLVNDGNYLWYQQHNENQKHYSIDNYVTEVVRWPFYLQHVPLEKQEEFFKKMPSSFFSIKTLDAQQGSKIRADLFLKYFGHIELSK
jgi:hypothetical protein